MTLPGPHRRLSWMLFHRTIAAGDLAALLAALKAAYPDAYAVLALAVGLDGKRLASLAEVAARLGIGRRVAATRRLLALGYMRRKWKERERERC